MLKMAERTASDEQRRVLIDLAATYHQLAEQLEAVPANNLPLRRVPD